MSRWLRYLNLSMYLNLKRHQDCRRSLRARCLSRFSSVTDGVVAGMNKLEIAELTVRGPTISVVPKKVLSAVAPTCVICFSNMVKLGDLQDDELYEELLEDVAEKCNTHGAVKSMVIPCGGTEESIFCCVSVFTMSSYHFDS